MASVHERVWKNVEWLLVLKRLINDSTVTLFAAHPNIHVQLYLQRSGNTLFYRDIDSLFSYLNLVYCFSFVFLGLLFVKQSETLASMFLC